MPRNARFWRNATVIALAHVAVAVLLVWWSRETPRPNLTSVVWLNGQSAAVKLAARSAAAPESPPPRETPPSAPDSAEEPRQSAPSEIQLPTPTPVPTPSPKRTATPTPVPTPVPKASVKPEPKPSPKKTAESKSTPKPSPKKSATPAEQKKAEENGKKAPATVSPSGADRPGTTDTAGAAQASEFSWYGKMLHDRFYSEWVQPTTSVAVGARMSALVRIRIEKDGRISKFTIARPSGNIVVDESVAAIAKKVTQVDPLPKGLGGAFYEVNINFELNPEP